MRRSYVLGRVLFGAALIGIGLEPFITGRLPGGLFPLKSVLPIAVPCGLGLLLVVAALYAVIRRPPSRAALLLAAILGLALLVVHLPRLLAEPRNPGLWAGAFEVVLYTGGALLLLPNRTAGRLFLAAGLIVFGVQHFMYAQFLANLIPSWIPFRLFFAYAVGCGFFATALTALVNRYTRLSGTVLSLMYLTWVVVLHIPRALAHPGMEAEVTSAMVALGMAGIGLLLAGDGEWTADDS